MALILLPDVVAAAVAYLNTVSEVTALVGDRIGTQLPAQEVWPAIRLDPVPGFAPLEYRLDTTRTQVQCFALTDLAAMTIARTVRAALVAMGGWRDPGVIVVTDVTTTSPALVQDVSRTPPVSHATFAATVTVRPDP